VKRIVDVLSILCLLMMGTAVFAEKIQFTGWDAVEYDYFLVEMDRLMAERGDEKLGDLTIADINTVAENLSISLQKTAFVEQSRRESMMFPGLGQLKNGDRLSGALFIAGNVATMTGTLLAAYFLLPDNVRFDQTNPFTNSLESVDQAWKSNSFVDYLPSIGAFLGGVTLNVVLRVLSANHAESLARENIANGNVEFQPFSFLALGMGGGEPHGRW